MVLGQIQPSTSLWHSLNVPLPRPAGRSLAKLGFLVPSKLPQGRLAPRHSAAFERGLQHVGRKGQVSPFSGKRET